MNRLVALLLLVAVSFPISPVTACDQALLTPARAFLSADYVFRGRVENLQYLDNPEQEIPEPRIIVTFSVSAVWKGKSEKQILIHTTHNKTTCNGYVFRAGQEYLVYAQRNRRAENFLARFFAPKKPTIGVKVFGGTKPIADAEADMDYLATISGARTGSE